MRETGSTARDSVVGSRLTGTSTRIFTTSLETREILTTVTIFFVDDHWTYVDEAATEVAPFDRRAKSHSL
ncbi:hypothetical protein NDI76_15860 [Halogeometricum sp. S1BR25-6]|uniref:Uncharacterized protein n=1 Tax=Halogeometricum salsisoli TaxID=2950536 RepID=A0ABU2GIY4_9EURY|nr:hypothetical protein [Halogeometricum sp. S1BR25-6]MDS0300223.1 hypothetical protein [Halogeometricum sp. S1BR25-6]